MEIRRENYEAFASQALVAALNAELLDRYDGFDGSGGPHVVRGQHDLDVRREHARA